MLGHELEHFEIALGSRITRRILELKKRDVTVVILNPLLLEVSDLFRVEA